jgi:hypothetical protein
MLVVLPYLTANKIPSTHFGQTASIWLVFYTSNRAKTKTGKIDLGGGLIDNIHGE